ncbi:hypothetical protein MA16_Dca023296 [Dendrobium catenatum]|uniref:Uncharacterized protein n=1 Tax=Dendrobium catenatum TaxID=906689 RepID=A0A2I0X612_9ASPA|nr:hypothetical protein MA16_Dca023296 [Dendrobium catenatum]
MGGSKQTVDKFIFNGGWNVNELQKYFGEELVNLISTIQILADCIEDHLDFIHKISGKTIFALASEALVDDYSDYSAWDWLEMQNLFL